MDGLNKAFMKDPKGFMEKYCIDIPYVGSILSSGDPKKCPPQGVHDFDLYEDKEKKCVFLRHVEERKAAANKGNAKPVNDDTNLITAYWLPWDSKKTMTMQLGDDAQFFFTSALGGCRIQVAGNTVAHVPGNLSPAERKQEGKSFAEAQGQGATSRRFSSTQDYGSKDQNEGLAFFTGYKLTDAWTFLGQKHTVDDNGAYHMDSALTATMGGTIWDSTAASADTFK